MVAFNTFLASVAASASALPVVFGAVLPQAQDSHSSISRREATWEEYDQQDQVFANIGICRYYLDPTSIDNLETCRQYCNNSPSVTCNGNANDDPSTISTNPDGERYTLGECWCDSPALADIIIKFTAEGLQELPGVTCAVWLEALKQSVELSTWVIPGAGAAAKAAKTIVKSVKLADKLGGKDGWTNFIQDTCHIDNWDFDISQSFDIFQQAPEQ